MNKLESLLVLFSSMQQHLFTIFLLTPSVTLAKGSKNLSTCKDFNFGQCKTNWMEVC